MKSTAKRTEKKKQIVRQEREQQWYIPPSRGIPRYNAEEDPNCPAARVRKFNEEQKRHIKEEVKKNSKSEQWVKAALDRQFANVSVKNLHDFRAKASEYSALSTQNVSDIAILQRIVVRENLLNELFKLCKSNNDLLPIMSELVELVKAIRFETLDVVEDIAVWRTQQPVPRPFLFKGINYLIKLRSDMDFLDQYDEVVERFCFEFKSNPLAYRGGGNIITGFDTSAVASSSSTQSHAAQHFKNLVQSYHQSFNDGKDGNNLMVDGIPILRLHAAEKTIQSEFDRIMKDANAANKPSIAEQAMSHFGSNPVQLRASWESAASFDPLLVASPSSSAVLAPGSTTGAAAAAAPGESSASRSSPSSPPPRPPSHIVHPLRQKKDRLASLREEVDTLLAMQAHLDDQLPVLHAAIQTQTEAVQRLAVKESEARAQGREGAARHLAAEASLQQALLDERRGQVKDVHRQRYFLALELRRKRAVIQQVHEDMARTRERRRLKKKIERCIARDGLLAALRTFDGDGRGAAGGPGGGKRAAGGPRGPGQAQGEGQVEGEGQGEREGQTSALDLVDGGEEEEEDGEEEGEEEGLGDTSWEGYVSHEGEGEGQEGPGGSPPGQDWRPPPEGDSFLYTDPEDDPPGQRLEDDDEGEEGEEEGLQGYGLQGQGEGEGEGGDPDPQIPRPPACLAPPASPPPWAPGESGACAVDGGDCGQAGEADVGLGRAASPPPPPAGEAVSEAVEDEALRLSVDGGVDGDGGGAWEDSADSHPLEYSEGTLGPAESPFRAMQPASPGPRSAPHEAPPAPDDQSVDSAASLQSHEMTAEQRKRRQDKAARGTGFSFARLMRFG